MIVKEMKRFIFKVNKHHKQLQLKLNDTYRLNKQKTVDLYHDSDRYEEIHIKSK